MKIALQMLWEAQIDIRLPNELPHTDIRELLWLGAESMGSLKFLQADTTFVTSDKQSAQLNKKTPEDGERNPTVNLSISKLLLTRKT